MNEKNKSYFKIFGCEGAERGGAMSGELNVGSWN